MTTLYSSLIRLHALHAGLIPQTQGHLAHAAFLKLVEQVDPDLSAALHDANARKPFTLSPLHGLPAPHRGEARLRAGHECWLRVTLASDVMFQTFINRFIHGDAHPTIRLGTMEFGVSAVLTTPGSHPWAGYTTAEALLAEARAEDTIALEFASPFSFSLGDNRVEIMPRPEMLFGGLRKKWAEWCGLPLPVALERDWLRENVLVGEWLMRSRMLRYGAQSQIGSEGTAIFRLFSADVDVLRTLNALADFAFYAGVGRKTPQGMGQVKRLDRWTPPVDEEEDYLVE